MIKQVTLTILLFYAQWVYAQPSQVLPAPPLSVIKPVADKIVRETPFAFQLTLKPPTTGFDFVYHVDMGRTYGLGKPAVAYALSQLQCSADTAFTVQVSHNDGLKIWINNQLVYEKSGARKVNITPRERDIVLESSFPVQLKKGNNNILVKSETKGKEWIFYLQPKGALIEERIPGCPGLTIGNIPNVSPAVASLSNWLVIGPFAGDLQTVLGPEQQPFAVGQLYSGNITWTIPKVEVFADVIDPRPYWGTYYNWNYHTGGVAWAMSNLAAATGEKQYDEYAKKWTDFMLDKKPFIGYQVNNLNGFQSTHHHLYHTPLLDFTAAPAMPFIHRLNSDKQFSNRQAYENFVQQISDYVLKQQIRLPEGNFTRETPKRFTTWTDDMFMGIPFMVQAAQAATDPKEKAALLNDAARQVLAFNKQVFDTTANLYRHAQYSDGSGRMPFWSRANGWGIWATTEILQQLPVHHPDRKKIMAYYKKHVDALVKYQDKQSGYWHNVLDRNDSYEEVSGTAIFTMAIARGINQGWLSRKTYLPIALLGWKAVTASVDPDGTVHNICVGTMSSEDVNYYMTRPRVDDDSHGIIGLLFAAIEMDKLLK
ncbi:MAG TPA: glycoside hydrolase family 88 protein [Pseudobacter sp.]|nr:glycoside hydrolase family 88 protein [Pseudobacter sp.]